MSTKQDGPAFTARDFKLLAGVFDCVKDPVQVDYTKFADKFDFKNSASAKASWHALKKKLDKLAGDGGTVAPSPSKTPAEGGKKRAAPDEEDEEASPAAKKGRKAPAGKKGKAAPLSDERVEDDEEGMPAEGVKEENDVKKGSG